jgi:class 3 adenylate cyclase
VWRRPGDFAVLVLALTIVGGAVKTGVGFEPLLSANPQFSFAIAAVTYATTPLFLLAAYTFPDGRFVPRATIVAWLVFAAWQLIATAVSVLRWDATAIGRLTYLVFLSTAPVAQFYRYRRAATEEQRQQLRWIVLASLIFLSAAAARSFLPLAFPKLLGDSATPTHLIFVLVADAAYAIAFASLPILVSIAVLRRRLFDVDTLLNRALVYGIVALVLALALAALVAVADWVARATGSEHAELITASVAVLAVLAFGPVRRRVAGLVDVLIPQRAVLTLLFCDVVGSTQQASTLGDARWRDLLSRYRAAVRRELKRFGGREVDTAGDGFFVMFDRPLLALDCAAAMLRAVEPLGLDVRTGVHTGACELRGEKISGLNVHAAARIMALARAGEILLSDDTRQAAGGGADVRDSGEHALIGVPGTWHLFALVSGPLPKIS